MNLTWSAVTVLLVLITPAFLLLAVLRINFFPKVRTIGPKDSTLLLICCFLSVLLTFDLLGNMGAVLAKAAESSKAMTDWEKTGLQTLLGGWDLPAFRPVHHLIARLFGKEPPENSFVVFLLELHFRTFFLGWILSWLLTRIAWVSEWIEYLPYRPHSDPKNWFSRLWVSLKDGLCFLLAGPKYTHGKSKYRFEMRRRSWLQKRLDHIREGFYHPWALLTATNRRREILMVDVLTEEGSLYSGKLTSWIPEQQGISAISMEYSLRYYPLSSEESKGEALPKVVNEKAKSSQAPVLSESKRRERKKDLVKNHGEMVIPSSQILTYHFWEIRRHFSCTIPIEKDSDLEVVKWYFLIAFVHDGFFDRITLQFGVERDKLISLLQKLRKWMNDNGIALPEKLVETQVESKAAPSTNASSKKKT